MSDTFDKSQMSETIDVPAGVFILPKLQGTDYIAKDSDWVS